MAPPADTHRTGPNILRRACRPCGHEWLVRAMSTVLTPCPNCGSADFVNHPTVPVCDFCSGHDPAVTFAADDVVVFVTDTMQQRSLGGWAACAECAALIAAGEKDKLLYRGIRGNIALVREMEPRASLSVIRKAVEFGTRTAHAAFWKAVFCKENKL